MFTVMVVIDGECNVWFGLTAEQYRETVRTWRCNCHAADCPAHSILAWEADELYSLYL